MVTLSALDIYYLVKEVKEDLEDSFLDKVYQGEDRDDLMFKLRSPKFGKKQLFIKSPTAIFLTTHRYPWPRNPPGFCMQLRKQLTNSQLKSIIQKDFERIIELNFVKGETKWKVIIELFNKGNIILVNPEGIIKGVKTLQRWKDRSLKVNTKYEYPKKQTDPRTISKKELTKMLAETKEEKLVKFLASELSLGGKYATEIIEETSLEKKTNKEITEKEIKIIYEAITSLFNKEIKELKPQIIEKSEVSPFKLNKNSNNKIENDEKEEKAEQEQEDKQTFSEIIEELVVKNKIAIVEKDDDKITHSASNKFEKIIKEQEKSLEKYEKSSKMNKEIGEKIYSNYTQLKTLLETIKRLHEKNGWKAVKKYVKENKYPIKINEKSGTITLEIKKENK